MTNLFSASCLVGWSQDFPQRKAAINDLAWSIQNYNTVSKQDSFFFTPRKKARAHARNLLARRQKLILSPAKTSVWFHPPPPPTPTQGPRCRCCNRGCCSRTTPRPRPTPTSSWTQPPTGPACSSGARKTPPPAGPSLTYAVSPHSHSPSLPLPLRGVVILGMCSFCFCFHAPRAQRRRRRVWRSFPRANHRTNPPSLHVAGTPLITCAGHLLLPLFEATAHKWICATVMTDRFWGKTSWWSVGWLPIRFPQRKTKCFLFFWC